MANERNQWKAMSQSPRLRRFDTLVLAALLTVGWAKLFAKDDHRHGNEKVIGYRQVNLVSDQAGIALLQDTNLVNAWGVSFSSTSPFWVSDNGTGKATLYAVTNDASGSIQVTKLGLEVDIPGEGNVTGQVFNNTTNFNGDVFIFVSEDGTISGWRGALGTSAEILATRSNAVYKGVTLVSTAAGPMLLAANFSEGTVDVYDSDLKLIDQLSDPHAPAGYAPFNVQSVEGLIFVTFAKQDADKEDDVAGPGNGLIDVLDLKNQRFHRFATGSDAGGRLRAIDSPWGVVLAPRTFDNHDDELLVGNFGSGTIMAFDEHGHFKGFIESSPGKPLVIEGLWALSLGNGRSAGVPGKLYFTAGPQGESHGLFGSVEPVFRRDKHDKHDKHNKDHDDDDDDDDDEHDDNNHHKH